MSCALCPRACKIDRSKAKGACRVNDELIIGAVVVHRGEEPPFVTGAGSGAVFFCGCPLRCSYCQNYQISQKCEGSRVTSEMLASSMLELQKEGCSNINLVSPTHYTPQILTALEAATEKGMDLPVIINSSGYESVECMKNWRGKAQIYLMDLKYGDNAAGKMLSGIDDYWDIAKDVITYLYETAGPLVIDDEGKAIKGLIIRHLVLPGMLSNPFSVFEFISELSLDIPLSIMSQYNPVYYTGNLTEMKRHVTPEEYQVAIDRASSIGFGTIYCQDMDAPSEYNPDFNADRPFDDMLKKN